MNSIEQLAKEIISSIEEEDENIKMRRFGYRKSGKAADFKSRR